MLRWLTPTAILKAVVLIVRFVLCWNGSLEYLRREHGLVSLTFIQSITPKHFFCWCSPVMCHWNKTIARRDYLTFFNKRKILGENTAWYWVVILLFRNLKASKILWRVDKWNVETSVFTSYSRSTLQNFA